MSEEILTIPTNPKHKLVAIVGDFKEFPVYGNSLLVSEDVAHLYTAGVIKSLTTSINKNISQELTKEIPGSKDNSNLDDSGIVKIGTKVKKDGVLVGRIRLKNKSEVNPEEKLLMSIFGRHDEDIVDISLLYPFQDEGVVINFEHNTEHKNLENIAVYVSIMKKLIIGDVLQDCSGNKGTVSDISPLELKLSGEYKRDGAGVIIHPDSDFVANVEGLAEKYLWQFSFHPDSKKQYKIVGAKSKKGGTSEKYVGHLISRAYGGNKTPEFLKFIGTCQLGYLTLERMTLFNEEKISARSTDQYSLVGQKPFLITKTGHKKGASVTKEELSALMKTSPNIVAEMLREKCDDPKRRSEIYERLVKNE